MADEETSPPTETKKGGGKWYKEMIGPLPAAAWLGVVGVALAFSIYRKKKNPVTTTTTPDPGLQDGSISPAGNIGVTGGGGGSGGTSPNGGQVITDNTQWYSRAMSDLVGRGYNPVLCDTALRDYIEGNALTDAETAIVNEALILEGPLPQPPPPAPMHPTTTPQGPTPTVPPPTNPGSFTGDVAQLQRRLNRMHDAEKWVGANVSGWPVLNVNGVYDSSTSQAVAAFQQSTTPPLPATGQADTITVMYLATAEAIFKLAPIG